MATYEAFVTLGQASIAISTVDVPLSVRTETSAMDYMQVIVTVLVPDSVASSGARPIIRMTPPALAGAGEVGHSGAGE